MSMLTFYINRAEKTSLPHRQEARRHKDEPAESLSQGRESLVSFFLGTYLGALLAGFVEAGGDGLLAALALPGSLQGLIAHCISR